jgi:hypothetical protein
VIAKIVLSFSILYGVTFAALLQFYYDEYSINVRAYTTISVLTYTGARILDPRVFHRRVFLWAFNLI